jgi:hypothetical protein
MTARQQTQDPGDAVPGEPVGGRRDREDGRAADDGEQGVAGASGDVDYTGTRRQRPA